MSDDSGIVMAGQETAVMPFGDGERADDLPDPSAIRMTTQEAHSLAGSGFERPLTTLHQPVPAAFPAEQPDAFGKAYEDGEALYCGRLALSSTPKAGMSYDALFNSIQFDNSDFI
jgi:hypothetical protein